MTSRELLRVEGEVEYPVPPLAQPEAVSLFCERARLEASAEIAELCALSTTCLSPSSSLPRERKRSPPPGSSSSSRTASTCSRAGATPIRDSRRSGRRSSGPTTFSRTRSKPSSATSRSSSAAARSRLHATSPVRASTRSSPSSRRTSFATTTTGTGCSRRFGSTQRRGSPSPETAPMHDDGMRSGTGTMRATARCSGSEGREPPAGSRR